MQNVNATQVWESLGSYVQKLCRNDVTHCEEIANEKKLNEIQRQSFYQLCGHTPAGNKETKSCKQIEDSLSSHEEKTNKSITLEVDGSKENIMIHTKLKKLRCFSDCKTIQMQNQKAVAIIINEWPLVLLNGIKEEFLHKIIRDTQKIEDDISKTEEKYILYRHTKFLIDIDIVSEINKKKGDGLTHFIDKLSFNFLKHDKHDEKCIHIMNVHMDSIKTQMRKLQIGVYNDRTKKFEERLTYKYFNMNMQRITSEQIPKTLFNYYIKLYKKCNSIINNWKEKRQCIQVKRENKYYSNHMTKDRNELFRAKRHKERNDKGNNKKPKKKKKKNKNKKNDKKNGKKDNKQYVITHFFRQGSITRNDINSNNNDHDSNDDMLNIGTAGLHQKEFEHVTNNDCNDIENPIQKRNKIVNEFYHLEPAGCMFSITRKVFPNVVKSAIFGIVREQQNIIGYAVPSYIAYIILVYFCNGKYDKCYKCGQETGHMCNARCVRFVCNGCAGWPKDSEGIYCSYHKRC